jgi:hypothetical protein
MNKTRFPVGFHPLHADVSINFQMNRWLSWVAEAEMLDEMRGLAPRITNYVDWKRDFLALAESADRRGHGLMAGFYFRAADFFMRTDDPDRRHARQQFLHARRSVYGLDQLGPPRGALRRRRRTRRLAGLPFHATTMQRHDRFFGGFEWQVTLGVGAIPGQLTCSAAWNGFHWQRLEVHAWSTFWIGTSETRCRFMT